MTSTRPLTRPVPARADRAVGVLLALAVTGATTLVVAAAPPAQAATLQQVASFGSNPRALTMFSYRPDGLPSGAPVVVERVVTRTHRLIDNGRRHAVQSSTGSYQLGEAHYVHARSGRACRRCGTTVRVAPIGEPTRERTMFYCPGCQGGLGPTDDGRRQAPLGSTRGAGRSRRSY